MDQETSHRLVTGPLQAWKTSSVLQLADDAELMEFMAEDCCQTALDKMWHGELKTNTKMWKVQQIQIHLYIHHYLPRVLETIHKRDKNNLYTHKDVHKKNLAN